MTETRTLTERLNDFGPFANGQRTGKHGVTISDGESQEYGVWRRGRLLGEYPLIESALMHAEQVVASRDAFTGGVA
jgi:hypothetical protein